MNEGCGTSLLLPDALPHRRSSFGHSRRRRRRRYRDLVRLTAPSFPAMASGCCTVEVLAVIGCVFQRQGGSVYRCCRSFDPRPWASTSGATRRSRWLTAPTSFNAFNGDRSSSVKPFRLHSLAPICSLEVWNSVLLKLQNTGKYVSFPYVLNFCSLERLLDGRQFPHSLILSSKYALFGIPFC